ncbi:MAG: GNAT family N-acetyltransferase [Actinomycetota bacterium]|nr:GNAT family N-acetyltransferase [Actinomycetota bacterium]
MARLGNVAVDYLIRPMRVDDVPSVERLTAEAFYDLDVRTHRAGWPEPAHRTQQRSARWQHELLHILEHDGNGCWIAENDSGAIGAAASTRRDLTWILATFVVRRGYQGRGVGRQLLDASSSHGNGCLRAMLVASEDPLAVRRYRLAGFTMHPTMLLRGKVARFHLPVVERVREGSRGDIDLLNSVDRQIRGSAHGVDHELLTTMYRLVVVDRSTGSGYAYVEATGGAHVLVATNRRTASDLLWEALAASSPEEPCTVGRLTPAQEWAIDVGLSARMELHSRGYLALRDMKPPMPYIPSGHFL